MLIVLLAAALAGAPAPASAADDQPLTALAARAADEITRIAAGRPVQLEAPGDASALGTAARDLHGLIVARLGERASTSGARLRVASILGATATRLRLVGRVTLESSEQLVDVFAVSVAADPGTLARLARPAGSTSVTVTATTLSGTVAARVLDIAFVENRLVVLFADAVALYRREGATLTRLDARPLERTTIVRAPAGIIVSTPGESACWVATNLSDGTILFSVDGDRLREIQRAPVFPFPGARRGARFRSGTNLIEIETRTLGDGPHLRAGGAARRWAIGADGRLGFEDTGWTDVRVGAAAADLWPGMMVTTSPLPPGSDDVIVVREKAALLVTLPVAGAVTAVGARAVEGTATIAAGVDVEGAHRILLVDLARAE